MVMCCVPECGNSSVGTTQRDPVKMHLPPMNEEVCFVKFLLNLILKLYHIYSYWPCGVPQLE